MLQSRQCGRLGTFTICCLKDQKSMGQSLDGNRWLFKNVVHTYVVLNVQECSKSRYEQKADPIKRQYRPMSVWKVKGHANDDQFGAQKGSN